MLKCKPRRADVDDVCMLGRGLFDFICGNGCANRGGQCHCMEICAGHARAMPSTPETAHTGGMNFTMPHWAKPPKDSVLALAAAKR
jgi:hypothetical protein